MIDCMACLVQLACGCPTSGRIRGADEVTHAVVTIHGTAFVGTRRVPVHGFRWSRVARRWMFFIDNMSYWATLDQKD